MSTYPALINPDYGIKEEREDSTVRSEFSAGYQQSRQRYTRVRHKWTISYSALDSTSVYLLQIFYDDTVHGGADAFDWTNPVDENTYQVRFDKPIAFEAFMKRDDVVWYKVQDIVLVQV